MLETYELVGDEELLYKSERNYTLKCVSGTGSVLVLAKSVFYFSKILYLQKAFMDKIATEFNRNYYFKKKIRS